MEHLDPIRLTPARVLQIGADPGGLSRELIARYPGARVVLVDDCVELLHRAAPATRWPRLRRAPVSALCAHPSALPLPGASADLLCSNLALGLMDDATTVLREGRRALRHGGLLMLSFLAPDSFRELREAWSQVDPRTHLHRYPDLHDVGDALVRAGFSDVVVDVERLQAEFDDVDHLLHELRAIGGGHAGLDRRRGLTSPRALRRLRDAYPHHPEGAPVRATLEVGYAHAWVFERAGVEVALPGT